MSPIISDPRTKLIDPVPAFDPTAPYADLVATRQNSRYTGEDRKTLYEFNEKATQIQTQTSGRDLQPDRQRRHHADGLHRPTPATISSGRSACSIRPPGKGARSSARRSYSARNISARSKIIVFSSWPRRSPGPAPMRSASSRRSTRPSSSRGCSRSGRAGLYHNTAVIIDADGSIKGIYRKMHIPDDPLYYEKFYFTPGDTGFRAWETTLRQDRRADLLGPMVSRRRPPDGAARRRDPLLSHRHRLASRGKSRVRQGPARSVGN